MSSIAEYWLEQGYARGLEFAESASSAEEALEMEKLDRQSAEFINGDGAGLKEVSRDFGPDMAAVCWEAFDRGIEQAIDNEFDYPA